MENRTKLKERAMDSSIAFIFVITLVISFLIYNFPGVNSVAPSVSPFLVLIPENMTSSEISEYAGITKTYSYDLSQAAQITPGGNVEKALYIDKLTVDYDTEYTDFCLPPLTLQPIVENSVKHGIKQTHEPEHIVIRTRKASGGAEVIVEDNGPGITTDSADSSGHVGLKNVTERLKIMCGGNISIGVRPGGGSVVTIHVNCPERQG